MKIQEKTTLAVILAAALMFLVATIRAHNGAYLVPSPGRPAAAITLDGVETGAEWTGATPATFDIDYGGGDPLKGHVKALHKIDGIYLLVNIEDANTNINDTLEILFDINHNGTVMTEASDFGVEVKRENVANAKKWGPANADHNTWLNIPPANVGMTTGGAGWTVEFHLPTGAPSNLALGANGGVVGIYFSIYNADNAFGLPSAKYTQWPKPPMASPDALLDTTPDQWGNYAFDPASTFPNITVTDVRRGDDGPANYTILSRTGTNRFDVGVSNPGGTAIGNATNVRLNLYLAARGIGEPWHRLDQTATIDADCAAVVPWPSTVLLQNKVCMGAVSLGDISNQLLANVVANTADYTIKKGVARLDGGAVTIPAGPNNYYQVLNWSLMGQGQDSYFAGDRAHECMLAEALSPNDPNPADNTVQANMDFESLGGGGGGRGGGGDFRWGMGNAGFAQYDPARGKDMFLEVSMRNMDKQAGWEYKLDGVKSLDRENLFVAHLQGKESIEARLFLSAPSADVMGLTLKENMIVRPQAGGFQVNAQVPSGEPPVYVKVVGGSTLLIANYAFTGNDEQSVDLDGNGKLLPPNGPSGLPASAFQNAVHRIGERFRVLLAPNAPLGALVGSWDNFRTAFLIAEGVQVKVPAGARFLALGINDGLGFYQDNTGTGFRVKIVQRAGGTASSGMPTMMKASFESAPMTQQRTGTPDILPIRDVMPTFCINGYEDIGQKRSIDGTPHELFRYIGNVCWGIINVYPPDRSEKPDQGDAFDGQVPPKPKGCGSSRKGGFAFASFMTLLGIVVIRRSVRRKVRAK